MTLPTSRTRKTAGERREEIVRAVLKIIGERGQVALTTSALAQEVGVTTGALFRHFPSLEAMLRETARHALARLEATFPDAGLPPLERLMELARRRIELVGSDPGLAWLLRSEQAVLTLPEDAVGWLLDMVARSRRFLVDALREGAADGTFRGDIDPESLLVPVVGTIHVLSGTGGVHGRSAVPRAKVDAVLTALARMLAPPGRPDRGPGADEVQAPR